MFARPFQLSALNLSQLPDQINARRASVNFSAMNPAGRRMIPKLSILENIKVTHSQELSDSGLLRHGSLPDLRPDNQRALKVHRNQKLINEGLKKNYEKNQSAHTFVLNHHEKTVFYRWKILAHFIVLRTISLGLNLFARFALPLSDGSWLVIALTSVGIFSFFLLSRLLASCLAFNASHGLLVLVMAVIGLSDLSYDFMISSITRQLDSI